MHRVGLSTLKAFVPVVNELITGGFEELSFVAAPHPTHTLDYELD